MHIVPELGVGGLPQVVSTLCETTDASRFDVSVLCLNFVGEIGDSIRRRGIPVFNVGRADGRPNYTACLDVARVLRREKIDLVHTHNTQAFVDGTLGAKLAGVRRVIHSDHARLFPDKRRYLVAEWMVSQLADKVVGVSDHTSRELRQYVKISQRKLLTIPNGITGERYQLQVNVAAKMRELGIEGHGPVFGIGARLVEQKAHCDLLDAMVHIRREFPKAVLLICGEGELESDLRRQTERLGLEDNVRFLGVRLDMPELLQVFDLYVLPSLWEGLPMALLEAMAAGCPIVASAVGGVPTAVVDGVNGTTIPPRQPQRLAEAMIQLLRDPERRERYVRTGRAMFEERFSSAQMTRAYEELYLGR